MDENTSMQSPEPLFLRIPITRLIILSIVSFGLFEAYWIYKNWRYLDERDRLNIHPFWRGIFGIFFCHSLMRRIHKDEITRSVEIPTFSASGLATGWVVLAIIAYVIGWLPVSYVINWLPSGTGSTLKAFIPSFLCLVPAQSYINSVEKKRNPDHRFYGWSFGHVVCLVYGIFAWAFLLVRIIET